VFFSPLGTSAEDFIKKPGKGLKSKKEKLNELLAETLGVHKDNVDIVTVIDVGKGLTDIRYAAHGSPYYQASQVDSAIIRNQKMVCGEAFSSSSLFTIHVAKLEYSFWL
jgi:hypothetical protein